MQAKLQAQTQARSYEQLEYLVHIYQCKGGFIIFGCWHYPKASVEGHFTTAW
jgi:hypothetical protein